MCFASEYMALSLRCLFCACLGFQLPACQGLDLPLTTLGDARMSPLRNCRTSNIKNFRQLVGLHVEMFKNLVQFHWAPPVAIKVSVVC